MNRLDTAEVRDWAERALVAFRARDDDAIAALRIEGEQMLAAAEESPLRLITNGEADR